MIRSPQASPVPPERARAPEPHSELPNWVATVRDHDVMWLRRSPGPRRLGGLPPLPAPVLRAARAADGLVGCDLWTAVACVDASHVLLFGAEQEAAARTVVAKGQARKLVRCFDEREARKVAEILALRGDVVLVSGEAIAIFSPVCGLDGRRA